MMKPNPRPLSITSPGFSTLTADRPPLNKCASDSNLKGDGGGGDGLNNGTDLNREVAALSNKLISAINHQTKLDDSLSATKHELELSKARIRHLEATAKEHADLMASGLLVDKKEVESETQLLLTRLKEESQQRGQAEKDKRNIEQELENLTTALFDEANKMVSAARKERDAVDRKNEQLRAQLADTESLLASHQEQLAELKAVMQQMSKEREESEAAMSPGIPSTPSMGGRSSKDGMGRIFEALHLIPNPGNLEDMPPCPPTALINLVHPVLRHDTASYKEFRELLHTLKPSELRTPPGASSIGSSLFGLKKRSDSNSTTHSPSGSASSTNEWQATINALKETKFFKRAVMEDIEPTLRLDCAPGLSWLARRNVMSAITDGTLVIDPMPTAANVSIFACALCGESKPDEQHARTHRMRINESPNAQRYPVCSYCTTRLRSVCDFMAFLRTLKEGLWKCESEGDMKHAWEESVKLREKLFWARIGGGVVPAFIRESRRNSLGNGQTETPPRTPILGNMLDDAKLSIPKKRSSQQNPFLAPEKQTVPAPTNPPPPMLGGDSEPGVFEVRPCKEVNLASEIVKERLVEVQDIETVAPVQETAELPDHNQSAADTPMPTSPITTRPKSSGPALAAIRTEFAAAPIARHRSSPTSPSIPGGW